MTRIYKDMAALLLVLFVVSFRFRFRFLSSSAPLLVLVCFATRSRSRHFSSQSIYPNLAQPNGRPVDAPNGP